MLASPSHHSTQLVDVSTGLDFVVPVLQPLDAHSSQQGWMSTLQALECERFVSRLLYTEGIKRFLDIVMAAILLVLLTPLWLIVALAIKLERRTPCVIFRQNRIGRYGRPFVIYKFCTMIADRRKDQLPYGGPFRRVAHKTPNDPRVTRVGRFLRSTSLDEIPQLINILRGEMSFVGPRPELPMLVDRYEQWQHHRHLVTPGLTGWWQVHGRSSRPMHENTDLDIYYVANQSFLLDLSIVLRTIGVVISRKGAFIWLFALFGVTHVGAPWLGV
jgi:lipopolysaccharide/colanic/teichoic acid biosynthesis glycosyltransferase